MVGLWILLMVLFLGEALIYVWCRSECVNAGYSIDREVRRRQALIKARGTLRIELARLKSPERIESIARNRLNLVMPDAGKMVRLP